MTKKKDVAIRTFVSRRGVHRRLRERVESAEVVIDVQEFVHDRLLDVGDPVVADVLRLDANHKISEFAKYLDEYKD